MTAIPQLPQNGHCMKVNSTQSERLLDPSCSDKFSVKLNCTTKELVAQFNYTVSSLSK